MLERNAPPTPPLRLRTVFISDIHLGFKGCSAELLLDFLHHVEMDCLFLVGDIVDVWSMKRTMYWPQSHNNVLRTILGKAKRGTKVIFVPGNHDEVFREFDGAVFGNLEIHREYIHQGADGRRMLVLHGDEFDSVVKCSPWLAKLGSDIYDVLLAANPYINWVRRKFGLPHWSLSSYLKNKAKTAVQYIGSFEDAVAQAARRRGVDTVVCGHIHRAEMREINGVLYCNDGDWVESCTSLVEDMNGQLRLIDWPKLRAQVPATCHVTAGRASRLNSMNNTRDMWSLRWHAMLRSLARRRPSIPRRRQLLAGPGPATLAPRAPSRPASLAFSLNELPHHCPLTVMLARQHWDIPVMEYPYEQSRPRPRCPYEQSGAGMAQGL